MDFARWTASGLVNLRTRRSRVLTDADRIRIVLQSFEEGALVSVVARQNGVAPRQLSHWRSRYRAGKLRDMDAGVPTVPVSELADAKQRIRELERELGRKALENAMLREAIEFAHLPASVWRKAARVTPRKK